MKRILPLLLLMTILCARCQKNDIQEFAPRATQADGFVYLDEGHFVLGEEEWFPMMVNYKVDWRREGDSIWISSAYYYENPEDWDAEGMWQSIGNMQKHFSFIYNAMGANAIRICLDVVNSDEKGYFYGSSDQPIYLIQDSCAIFRAIDRMVEPMNGGLGMKVMILLKAPLDEELEEFTSALLRHETKNAAIWAYDFMNEPLYFDPAEKRSKQEAYRIVAEWRRMMEQYAPHQLFTIGFAEPIEVFEWDPSILPVDFVEVHTYHPLRVGSEMYWYGHYCKKPWMVGETALPADNDSVSYEQQVAFLKESFQCAVNNGAIGYGWWEFQDCPQGVNFEAQYTGLLNHDGNTWIRIREMLDSADYQWGCTREEIENDSYWCIMNHTGAKPIVSLFGSLKKFDRHKAQRPCNYHNMLGYTNIALKGKIVERGSGKPIEGAVVRGWNDNWSVGMNTFTNEEGEFTLFSNDYCVHFEISAPGMSHTKFNRRNIQYSPKIDANRLKDKSREYQQIDYREFLIDNSSTMTFRPEKFSQHVTSGDLGTLKLKKL